MTQTCITISIPTIVCLLFSTSFLEFSILLGLLGFWALFEQDLRGVVSWRGDDISRLIPGARGELFHRAYVQVVPWEERLGELCCQSSDAACPCEGQRPGRLGQRGVAWILLWEWLLAVRCLYCQRPLRESCCNVRAVGLLLAEWDSGNLYLGCVAGWLNCPSRLQAMCRLWVGNS